MRKLLISLLLAGAAATPALGGPRDHSDRENFHSDHQQSQSQSRSDHSDRSDRSDRSERAVQVQRPEFAGHGGGNRSMGGGEGRFNGSMDRGAPTQFVRPEHLQQGGQADVVQNDRPALRDDSPRGPRMIDNAFAGRNGRGVQRDQIVERREQIVDEGDRVRSGGPRMITNETLRQQDRALPPVMRPRTRTLVVSDVPRPGTQPPLRTDSHRRTGYISWNTNWRNDHRHDWRDWRRRHHSWFHLGFYYDPFGWGYQPYSIGWRMWPSYYGNSFWINDPWQYRLPYAPAGTVWVRYYNDAVLVDTFTGEVLDVVYDFFW
jgi:Ni/Co efflux regulator RcnB